MRRAELLTHHSPAVLLCSPVVRKYVINYGRPFIYSTSLSYSTIAALDASFDYIESAAGTEVRHSMTIRAAQR